MSSVGLGELAHIQLQENLANLSECLFEVALFVELLGTGMNRGRFYTYNATRR